MQHNLITMPILTVLLPITMPILTVLLPITMPILTVLLPCKNIVQMIQMRWVAFAKTLVDSTDREAFLLVVHCKMVALKRAFCLG